jgi:hypothetical protein
MAKRIFKTTVALSAVVGLPAIAGGMNVAVTVPQLQVAEYHKPYVAVWLEKADGGVAANLSVWYDAKMKNAEGTKWLKDMRQWWRRTGRELSFPIDGVTQPTKPVGTMRCLLPKARTRCPSWLPVSTS